MIKFKNILKEAFEGMNSVVSIGGPTQMKEAAPKMKSNPEAKIAADVMMKLANLKKGGSGNRYGREFEKAKTKALRAMEDMISYIKIGV
tara:strand:+ start:5951 stop:6217 length:267 start_codon:yes stop_codon:yes gene_type:complete